MNLNRSVMILCIIFMMALSCHTGGLGEFVIVVHASSAFFNN